MKLEQLNEDKYLSYFAADINIIVIYEHYRYDSSDYDSLNTPQINYLLDKVAELNPSAKSGRKIELEKIEKILVFPKPSILGASSFDVLRYEKQDDSFIYVLTPTQAACYFLTLEDEESSKELLTVLLSKHPVNLKKIAFQVRTEYAFRQRFNDLKSELTALQLKTVQLLEEKGQSHLGRVF